MKSSFALPKRVGVIEIGSRSVRLLVSDLSAQTGLIVIAKDVRQSHLAAALGGPEAILHTKLEEIFGIVKSFVERCHSLKICEPYIFATASFREMPQETIAKFCVRLPQLQILDKRTEACCSLVAAANEFTASKTGEEMLVIDQGTGSMEMALGRASQAGVDLNSFRSYKLGTQNLVEELRKVGNDMNRFEKGLETAFAYYKPIGEFCLERPIILGSAATKIAWFQAKTNRSVKSDKYDPALAHGQLVDIRTVDIFVRSADQHPGLIKDLLDPQQGGEQAFELLITGLIALRVLLRRIGKKDFKVSALGTRYGVAWMLGVYNKMLTTPDSAKIE